MIRNLIGPKPGNTKPILNVCQCNTEKYKFGDFVQRELASVVRKSPNLHFSVLHAANI